MNAQTKAERKEQIEIEIDELNQQLIEAAGNEGLEKKLKQDIAAKQRELLQTLYWTNKYFHNVFAKTKEIASEYKKVFCFSIKTEWQR